MVRTNSAPCSCTVDLDGGATPFSARPAVAPVLVATPDRLARHGVHRMVLLEELEPTGCQVEFLERAMGQDGAIN